MGMAIKDQRIKSRHSSKVLMPWQNACWGGREVQGNEHELQSVKISTVCCWNS